MSLRNNNIPITLPTLFAIVFLALMSQACAKKSTPTTPPEPTDQNASGIYNGTGTGAFSAVNTGTVIPLGQIKGIVNGSRFMFFNISTSDANKNVLYDGQITSITLTELVGTVDVYQGGNLISLDVPIITGIVNSRASVKLTFATKGNFLGGTVDATFNLLYDNVAAISTIDTNNGANNWKTFLPNRIYMPISGMGTGNFDIGNTAIYTIQTTNLTNTCNHIGQATIVSGVNVYTLAETISNTTLCNLDVPTPNYTGLMSVIDGMTGNDNEMWYAVTNKTYSVFGVLTRP